MLRIKLLSPSVGYNCRWNRASHNNHLVCCLRWISNEANIKNPDKNGLLELAHRYPLLAKRNTENKIKSSIKERKLDTVIHLWDVVQKFGWSLSQKVYFDIVKTCNNSNDKNAFDLGKRAILAAMADANAEEYFMNKITEKEFEEFARCALGCFSKCSNFADLFTLTFIWENFLSARMVDQNLDLEYAAVYINVLLNCELHQMAHEYYKQVHSSYKIDGEDMVSSSNDEVLTRLPTRRILNMLSETNDCEGLAVLLEDIDASQTSNNKSIIPEADWFKFLSTGLELCDYKLVKTIYNVYIMKGFSDGTLSSEDILFRDTEKVNLVFKNINDDTVLKILHTLSLNGDIDSTISLIESHFIYKRLVNSKSLSKDLCIKIIESYCYHKIKLDKDDEAARSNEGVKDESIKVIVDVIDSLYRNIVNSQKTLSYKDVTEAMSFKFANFRASDSNVQKARERQKSVENFINKSEYLKNNSTVLPRKLSNENIEVSSLGNILANLDVMNFFIVDHIQYIKKSEKRIETLQVFINCVLNHTNLYQNFSGTVKVLLALHHENPNFFTEWLTDESIEIIMNSMSNSGSAKLSSYYMFEYLKSRNKLSRHGYLCLISANLRGEIHNNLQFYTYNYLKDFMGMIDSNMKELLSSIPKEAIHSNEGTEKMISLCLSSDHLEVDFIENYWNAHHLSKKHAITKERITSFNKRPYLYDIDERDFHYLKYAVS